MIAHVRSSADGIVISEIEKSGTDDWETSVRVIDMRKFTIPTNCKQIVLTHNKTRIVIRNEGQPSTTSTLKRHELILKRVRDYFSDPQRFIDVKPYLLQTAPTSMRLLDYFVTSYARRNRLVLETKRNGIVERVDVFTDYKCFLKAYSKRSFDPFCRRVRSVVTFEGDPQKLAYVTTAAQANFLSWAHEIGLL
eukprot:5064165-Pleurochrysis_carterae.AAC.1